MQSVDRLILQIEMKKAKLFTTFHETAFKGYAHITQPKENLRALLKFAPPSSSLASVAHTGGDREGNASDATPASQ